MWLPNKNQVDTAGRYAGAIAGTAITIFGLQAKGITLDQVKVVIAALGDTVNQLVILAGIMAPLYATIKGVFKSSPTQQAISVEKSGGIVVTTPEIAQATPDSPNIVSQDQVKVVPK
jgi:hypothetical protein